jgi:hypothetical protein
MSTNSNKGVKKYWSSASVMFAHSIGELVRVCAPYCADEEASSKIANIAMSTRSILLKDGEYGMSKSDNLSSLKKETAASLNRAANDAVAHSVLHHGSTRINLEKVLSDTSLKGNEKQIVIYKLLRPKANLTDRKDRVAAGETMGISESTIRRFVIKHPELAVSDYEENGVS